MAAGVLFALSLPGLVVLLVVLAALEGFGKRRLPWHRSASGVGIEELDAFFSASKRAEMETRASMSMMRDEQDDGAPPPVQAGENWRAVTIAVVPSSDK